MNRLSLTFAAASASAAKFLADSKVLIAAKAIKEEEQLNPNDTDRDNSPIIVSPVVSIDGSILSSIPVTNDIDNAEVLAVVAKTNGHENRDVKDIVGGHDYLSRFKMRVAGTRVNELSKAGYEIISNEFYIYKSINEYCLLNPSSNLYNNT